MRIIAIILRKEFRQIFRNRAMLPILFVLPIIQLLLLSYAATFEVRETPIAVIDQDRSETSRALIARLDASLYFQVGEQPASMAEADRALLFGEVDMVMTIPAELERDLGAGQSVIVQVVLDAEDGATAGIVQSYATQIINQVNADITVGPPGIRIAARHWYNPNLEYTTFMVPGILVLLVTIIGTFLSAMNVVREKEIGTIEQLNVTPIKRYQFVVAKLLPFWVIGMAELGVGLVVARVVFAIPMVGSLWLVFALAGLYLLVMLGLGLWISTLTDTQQQAVFVAWFLMVIFILLSGLFTPIDSMPGWAQIVTEFNPIAHFIEIMRRILLKGAGFQDVIRQTGILAIQAVVILTLAVRQYQKRSG
ncbi:MAG: ABC-2 type transport system permease protein [Rhodothermales bacterium]|jgi:ABC-2 type transport system permease protein